MVKSLFMVNDPTSSHALLDEALQVWPIFVALSDRTRLELLGRLATDGTQTITRLAAKTELTRQAVTKQLRILENVGIVICTRIGREVAFSAAPWTLTRARELLQQLEQSVHRVTARS